MAVRPIVLPSGARVYQARVCVQGVRRSANRPTREAAKDAETDLRRQIRAELAGLPATADPDAPATLALLFDLYVADLEQRGKDTERARQVKTVLGAVLPELLTRPVSSVTLNDLFTFRRLRDEAGVKPSTINRDLRVLRPMLKRARPDLAFPRGLFFDEDETRVRWLRPRDERLAFAIPSPFREIARLATITISRLSEIRLLRRPQVSLDHRRHRGTLQLPRTKGGPKLKTFGREGYAILSRQLRKHDKDVVFPAPHGGPYSRVHISRVFRKAVRGAKIEDFHFHDLRHHAATDLLNKGFSEATVQTFGGWKTTRAMRRYAHVLDDTLLAAAEAVSRARPRRSR